MGLRAQQGDANGDAGGSMKERPILMNGAMVRATLAGTKTQTRRIVKPQPVMYEPGQCIGVSDMINDALVCPYGQPGDRLWVRETFGYVSPDEIRRPHSECNIEYRADLPVGCTDRPGHWPVDECAGDPERPRWRPSIHMPRAASRILLEIVSVRVERLNDISGADAIAEGIIDVPKIWPDDISEPQFWRDYRLSGDGTFCVRTPEESFSSLWRSINGADSWTANSWVWVVEFRRVLP